MSDNARKPPPPEKRLKVDWSGAEEIWLPEGQLVDAALRRAMVALLPAGVSMGFNNIGGQGVVEVSRPGDTRVILNAALASLGRPAVELSTEAQVTAWRV
jgi:hypothetical protein